MGPSDFGLSILASFIANVFSKSVEPGNSPVEDVVPVVQKKTAEVTEEAELTEEQVRFQTFDTSNDFLKLIEHTIDPVVHIVIESEPSSFYHLPVLVLECQKKGEWFVFSRGRMAFEGSHGGWNNSIGAFDILKSNKIPISVWVADVDIIRKLEGYHTWPELKGYLVPLIAAPNVDHKWSAIQRNIQRLLEMQPDKPEAQH